MQLATLKKSTEKAARTAGRAPANSYNTHRLVPLSDANYVSQLEMMVATLKIPLERRNKRSGSGRRGDVLRAGDTAHVPSFLCHTHAVCRYTTESAAEFNGTQEHQLDGGVHEGVCAR